MGYVADEPLVKLFQASDLANNPASIMPGYTTYVNSPDWYPIVRCCNIKNIQDEVEEFAHPPMVRVK